MGHLGHSLGALGTTYWALGALHQLCLDIFRTHELDFTIIKIKFWDNFKIQIGALVLILPKLEALTWGDTEISVSQYLHLYTTKFGTHGYSIGIKYI